ncbi:uncharacterized protein LOC141906931 isoform X2 [Tubulanus polymorphus]|uniref:uncharacterized protein LOC141906931 isoform X2 n=1 Tax=Tubulanus polymorphus TaxID=672921 RepID=UPI003DA1E423
MAGLAMCRPDPISFDLNMKPAVYMCQFRLTHDISIENFDLINEDSDFEFENDFNIDHGNSNTDIKCKECSSPRASVASSETDIRNVRARCNDVSHVDRTAYFNMKNIEHKKHHSCEKSDDRSADERKQPTPKINDYYSDSDTETEDSVFIEYERKPKTRHKRRHSNVSPDKIESPTDPEVSCQNKQRPTDLPGLSPRAVSPMSMSTCSEKSLAEEIYEAELALAAEQESNEQDLGSEVVTPKSEDITPQLSDSVDIHFNTLAATSKALLSSNNALLVEDSSPEEQQVATLKKSVSSLSRINSSCSTGTVIDCKVPRSSTSSSASLNIDDLEATHRGIHRFIPRHADEMAIEIGDMLHVIEECDDLWCVGVNLRTGKKGIFPAVYAQDLDFLDDDFHERRPDRFTIKFLGSVEVGFHKGNDVLCQAMQKVLFTRRTSIKSESPPLCCLEISEYGIRMTDKFKGKNGKSDEGFKKTERASFKKRLSKFFSIKQTSDEVIKHNHFFSLKNVSFCGYHPKDERYFGFITKHPREMRFAAHIFLSETSTKPIGEAIGHAFRTFYQEYMAFAHPTEDIYLE